MTTVRATFRRSEIRNAGDAVCWHGLHIIPPAHSPFLRDLIFRQRHRSNQRGERDSGVAMICLESKRGFHGVVRNFPYRRPVPNAPSSMPYRMAS